jgi:hypothetical protein
MHYKTVLLSVSTFFNTVTTLATRMTGVERTSRRLASKLPHRSHKTNICAAVDAEFSKGSKADESIDFILRLGELKPAMLLARPSASIKTPYVADVVLLDGSHNDSVCADWEVLVKNGLVEGLFEFIELLEPSAVLH